MKLFLTYFKALQYSIRPKNAQILPLLTGLALLYYNIGFSLATTYNVAAVFLGLFCSLIYCSGLALSNALNDAPNLYSLIPISSKRSLLYRFLSLLLMSLMMLVIIIAILIVAVLIGLIFSLIFSSGSGSDADISEIVSEEVYRPMGLYGGLFFVAYFILMYSAGMIVGLFKTRKARNSFALIFFGCIVLATLGTSAISGFVSPFVTTCYEAMSLPWLCIVFWLVAAAAMLGTAIYMGIKYYNPKKF